MSRSRARLAADWFAKLRQNAVTNEVEHTDVVAAEAAAAAEAIAVETAMQAEVDAIAATAAAYTAADVLAKLKTVDGSGSGLDADLLDGLSSASYLQDGGSHGTVTFNNWVRTTGATGWYNATYGGGFHMQDTTWLRTYNNKKIYVASTASDAINTAGGVQCATIRGGVPSTSASAVGSVGSYAYLQHVTANLKFNAGVTYAGSSLRYSGTLSYSSTTGNGHYMFTGSTAAGGTWRAMGAAQNYYSTKYPATLFLRIS